MELFSQNDLLNLVHTCFTQGAKEIECQLQLQPYDIRIFCDAYQKKYDTVLLWENRGLKNYLFEQLMVVHCQKLPYDIYIGRPNPKVKGSNKKNCKWGNPFNEAVAGSREKAIELYRLWIHTQPELLANLPELKNKVLGCWCAPKPCHGDVLVQMVRDYLINPTGRIPNSSEEIKQAQINFILVVRQIQLGNNFSKLINFEI